jgi:hypothetical protein
LHGPISWNTNEIYESGLLVGTWIPENPTNPLNKFFIDAPCRHIDPDLSVLHINSFTEEVSGSNEDSGLTGHIELVHSITLVGTGLIGCDSIDAGRLIDSMSVSKCFRNGIDLRIIICEDDYFPFYFVSDDICHGVRTGGLIPPLGPS